MLRPQLGDSVLALSRGFMESRLLLTAAELDLFSRLLSPKSVSEIVAETGFQTRALTVILDALAAMGLLSKMDNRYWVEADLLPFLDGKSPESLRPMLLHAADLWRRWSDLTKIVAETGGPDWPMADFREKNELKAFIGAMHVIASKLAPLIVAEAGLTRGRRLLDVGGASGTYALACLEASPEIRVTIFDRPPVIELARERLGQSGVLDRVTLVGGDFDVDDLPAGHDQALLSAIIHQNSPDQNVKLYRKILAALDPGGRLIIRDHIMNEDKTRPRHGAIFAVNMLVNTAGGGTYTFAEVKTDLEAAGFIEVRLIKNGEHMDGLVEAFKPR